MTSSGSGAEPNYNRPMHAREWALLFVIAALWGAAFFFVAIAIKDIPPLTLGAIRLMLGGSLLVCILYATGGKLPLDGRSLRWFAIMAFVNSLAPMYLLSWAQQFIGAGLNAILNGALPLWTLFVAHIMTREEKLTGVKLLGTLIGVPVSPSWSGWMRSRALTAIWWPRWRLSWRRSFSLLAT